MIVNRGGRSCLCREGLTLFLFVLENASPVCMIQDRMNAADKKYLPGEYIMVIGNMKEYVFGKPAVQR